MLRTAPASPSVSVSGSPPLQHVDATAPAPSVSDAALTTPTAPTSTFESDDVMRLVYANSARPTLHKDLWGEIAKFASRRDMLNLRSTSTDVSKWVDKSITSLTVKADQAPAILAAMGSATNLNHIRSLRIEGCTNESLQTAVQALSVLPHATLDVTLSRDRYVYALDAHAVEHLGAIAPASLKLSNFGTVTAAVAQVLARLNYPIHLCTGHVRDVVHDERLQALADIPQLIFLDVMVSAVEDTAAQALGAHPTLTELHLGTHGSHRIVMSDEALTALANSATLRKLHLARIPNHVGEQAMAVLARNRTLDSLCLGCPGDVFEAPVALALSENTTLKTLHISLNAGFGHLARMPSLERLSIGGKISLDDARQFAEHAHLKALHAHCCEFAPGALAVIAGSQIVNIMLTTDPIGTAIPVLTDADIDAFLGNKALRSLLLVSPAGPNANTAQAIRLAGHPCLGVAFNPLSPHNRCRRGGHRG